MTNKKPKRDRSIQYVDDTRVKVIPKRKKDCDAIVAAALKRPKSEIALITELFILELRRFLLRDGLVTLDDFANFKLRHFTPRDNGTVFQLGKNKLQFEKTGKSKLYSTMSKGLRAEVQYRKEAIHEQRRRADAKVRSG